MICEPLQRTAQIWNEPGHLATARALQQDMSYEGTAELLLRSVRGYETIESRRRT